MHKHHVAGIAAVSIGLGVLVGVIVGGGHREAAGDPNEPDRATTVNVRLINHCGHLVYTEAGTPLEATMPLVPPVSGTALSAGGASLPDMGDAGTMQVVAHPPYLKAFKDPAVCK